MRRGFAFQAMLLTFALAALGYTAWWAWDRVDPVVEFERDPANAPRQWDFKKPPAKLPPRKGKGLPGLPPPMKPPAPDMQQSPQIETRPRLQAARLFYRS
jgi:hypothetical protein